MVMKFDNYNCGFRIISLAVDPFTAGDLMEEGLDFIFMDNDHVILMPDHILLSPMGDTKQLLCECNNYDVFELWPDGRMFIKYDTQSIDNYFFVTGRCNSNCVMCPSSEASRRNGDEADVTRLIELASHIPSDAPHLTITGGEPFLGGEDIFKFVSFLRDKFSNTECLFLTNGRIFSLEKYLKLLCETLPANSILAIPIHAPNEELHDFITQSKGSFRQTVSGIKHLLRAGIRIELRVVVSKLNAAYLSELADFIIREIPQIEYVSVIAMEMTGNAFMNREKVWIPYKQAFQYVLPAVQKLIGNEIDVKLYNFPLCTVDPSYWMLCKKSISPDKVRYVDTCAECKFRTSCGGVFAGTINIEREELRAIR